MNLLDTFPERFPPSAPHSCPNPGTPRGTPDAFKEQPEISETPPLLLVILHVQNVSQKTSLSGIISGGKASLPPERHNKEAAKRLPKVISLYASCRAAWPRGSTPLRGPPRHPPPAASSAHPAQHLVTPRLFIYSARTSN